MKDGVATTQHAIQRCGVEDAARHDLGTAVHGRQPVGAAGREVVEDDNVITAFGQGADEVMTDESGAAGDEDPHAVGRSLSQRRAQSSNIRISHRRWACDPTPDRCSSRSRAATSMSM